MPLADWTFAPTRESTELFPEESTSEIFTELTSTELSPDFISSAKITTTGPVKLIPTTESESTTQHFSMTEITEVLSVKKWNQ